MALLAGLLTYVTMLGYWVPAPTTRAAGQPVYPDGRMHPFAGVETPYAAIVFLVVLLVLIGITELARALRGTRRNT